MVQATSLRSPPSSRCCVGGYLIGTLSAISHLFFRKDYTMKKQTSYTPTLTIGSAEQKLVDQIMRESKGMIPTLDAVVYKLALEGLRHKLEEKKEENRQKRAKQLAGKASASEGKSQKSGKTSESAQ